MSILKQTIRIGIVAGREQGVRGTVWSKACCAHALAQLLADDTAGTSDRDAGRFDVQPVLVRAEAGTGKTWLLQQTQQLLARGHLPPFDPDAECQHGAAARDAASGHRGGGVDTAAEHSTAKPDPRKDATAGGGGPPKINDGTERGRAAKGPKLSERAATIVQRLQDLWSNRISKREQPRGDAQSSGTDSHSSSESTAAGAGGATTEEAAAHAAAAVDQRPLRLVPLLVLVQRLAPLLRARGGMPARGDLTPLKEYVRKYERRHAPMLEMALDLRMVVLLMVVLLAPISPES